MGIKKYKPTSPGRRFSSVDDFADITVTSPLKKLTKAKSRSAGRNSSGKITVRHRGGGAKRRIRVIDFKQDKFDIPGKIETIEYDPEDILLHLIKWKLMTLLSLQKKKLK